MEDGEEMLQPASIDDGDEKLPAAMDDGDEKLPAAAPTTFIYLDYIYVYAIEFMQCCAWYLFKKKIAWYCCSFGNIF